MSYQHSNTRLFTGLISSILLLVVASTSTSLAQLPNPGMQIDPANTALVITDPQNDFLSPSGATWGVVGKSVEANNTVPNIEKMMGEISGMAMATGTVIYGVSSGPASRWSTDFGDGLANATGGRFNRELHEIGDMVDRAGRDCACMYRIGIVPPPTSSSRVLRVKVAVGELLFISYKNYGRVGDYILKNYLYKRLFSEIRNTKAIIPLHYNPSYLIIVLFS